jgi:hypothetical protein
VEPTDRGARLRTTQAYRDYGARVGMWQWRWAANDCRRPLLVSAQRQLHTCGRDLLRHLDPVSQEFSRIRMPTARSGDC